MKGNRAEGVQEIEKSGTGKGRRKEDRKEEREGERNAFFFLLSF